MMKERTKIKGFSLLEISIVLTVVAVAVGSGVMVFNKYSNESKVSQTEFTMKQVMKAIKQYTLEYGELPCPADITDPQSDANFGLGVTPGTCTGAISNDNLFKGMVPVHTLNIYPSLAMDAWGNRFDYQVVQVATADDALCTPSGAGCTPKADAGDYVDLQNYGKTNFGSSVLVVLLSHGANGFGAYSGRGGSQKGDTNANVNEQANNGTAGSLFTSLPYRGFDDIVEIWTFDQLMNEDVMD